MGIVYHKGKEINDDRFLVSTVYVLPSLLTHGLRPMFAERLDAMMPKRLSCEDMYVYLDLARYSSAEYSVQYQSCHPTDSHTSQVNGTKLYSELVRINQRWTLDTAKVR